MNDIKLLIADDHAIVRTGLVALLESSGGITVVGEADGAVNRAEAVAIAMRKQLVKI